MVEFLKIWVKESCEFLKFLFFLLGIGKFVEELLVEGNDLAVKAIGRLLIYSFILALLELYRRKKYKRWLTLVFFYDIMFIIGDELWKIIKL